MHEIDCPEGKSIYDFRSEVAANLPQGQVAVIRNKGAMDTTRAYISVEQE